MLIEASFFFDTEVEESVLNLEEVDKWAKEINDDLACFVIGYYGWRVRENTEINKDGKN